MRASELQSKKTVNLVECLLKVKYPVYHVDHQGNIAINTLLKDKSINEAALVKVLEWHIKYCRFDLLRAPESEDGTTHDSFFIAFVKSSLKSDKIIEIIKQRLWELNFEEINDLISQVNALGVPLTEQIDLLISNLKKDMIKRRKAHALYLYHKLR